MSDAVLLAIVAGIFGLLNILITAWVARRQDVLNKKSEERSKVVMDKIDKVDAKVEVVHITTNSLTDKLIASTAKASHAEGMADEKKNQDKIGGAI